DGTTADVLLDRADEAMYAAKRRGTGVSSYESDGEERADATATRVDQLREAIRDDLLALEFQPSVRLRDRSPVRLEALVRWPQRASGVLHPAAFVGMAERNGLGPALSTWVLRRALQRYRDWQLMGIGDGISVNVSIVDVSGRGFRERVLHELQTQQVEPSALTLEVSARALNGATIARIERPLAELSETGV